MNLHPQRGAVAVYLDWLIVGLAFSIASERQWATILAALIMLLWWMDGRVRCKIAVIVRDPLWLALLCFFAANALSLLWSADFSEGLRGVLKHRYLLLAPMVATSLHPRCRKPAMVAFLLGVGVSLALSAAALFGVIQSADITADNPSVTMSHLDYSMVLAVAALLVLNHLVAPGLNRRRRCWWLLAFAAIASGLLLNIGRSGQFAFFAALLVIAPFLFVRRSWRTHLVAPMVVFLFAILVYAAVPVFQDRIDSAVFELQDAVSGRSYDSNQGKRIAAVIVARDMFLRDPLFGSGIGAAFLGASSIGFMLSRSTGF